jgi:hypothetical protein
MDNEPAPAAGALDFVKPLRGQPCQLQHSLPLRIAYLGYFHCGKA